MKLKKKLIEITHKFHLLFPYLLTCVTLRQDDPGLTVAVQWKRSLSFWPLRF